MNPFRLFWDFWFAPIRAESLALFRILLGVTILCSLFTGIFRTLPQTCGEDPLLPIEANDNWIRNNGRISLLRGPHNIPLLGEWLPAELARDENGKRTRLSKWTENWAIPEDKDADKKRQEAEEALERGEAPKKPDKTPAEKRLEAWAEWGAKPSSHYLLAACYVVALLGLILGFRPRLMALAGVLLGATFYNRLPELMNGGDGLMRNGLYLLMLSPSGAAWSVDRWLQTRHWSLANRMRRLVGAPELTPDEPPMIGPWWVWSVRLIQIQVCCMYFFTAWYKHKSDYLDGTAMYWVMNDLELTRWSYVMLPVPLFVCKLMTWTALIFEWTFAFLVWLRRRPAWMIIVAYFVHAALFVGLVRYAGLEEYREYALLFVVPGLMVVLHGLLGFLDQELLAVRVARVASRVVIYGHVVGLVYLAAATLLVAEPYLTMALILSLLVYCGPDRKWVLLMGLGLHLGILVTMEIGWFSQVTMCFYAVFVSGETVSRWANGALAWLRGAPKPPAVDAAAVGEAA